jgi:tRNA pseudouridine55 synthase
MNERDSHGLRGPQTWTGAILIDKPEGITSAHVLDRFKRVLRNRYGWKSRELPTLGHGGTLDPFATGLLVVLIGNATRLSQYLLGSDKTYAARLRFGSRTWSGDFTGEVIETTATLPTSLESIQRAAFTLTQTPEYLQIPPMVSAKKKEGVALHTLARQGIEIPRDPVSCRIHSLEFGPLTPATDPISEIDLITRVSGGTYIRVLGEDLAKSLDSLGHLTSLRRLASGPFRIEDALSASAFEEYLSSGPEDFSSLQTNPFWVSPFRLTWKLRAIEISEAQAHRARTGAPELPTEIMLAHAPHDGSASGDVVLTFQGELIAILKNQDSRWVYARVFPKSVL